MPKEFWKSRHKHVKVRVTMTKLQYDQHLSLRRLSGESVSKQLRDAGWMLIRQSLLKKQRKSGKVTS